MNDRSQVNSKIINNSLFENVLKNVLELIHSIKQLYKESLFINPLLSISYVIIMLTIIRKFQEFCFKKILFSTLIYNIMKV